jgi:hypothetical protein
LTDSVAASPARPRQSKFTLVTMVDARVAMDDDVRLRIAPARGRADL